MLASVASVAVELALLVYVGNLVDSLVNAPGETLWADRGTEFVFIAIGLLLLRPLAALLKESADDIALGHHACVNVHRVKREGLMNLVGLGLGISLISEHWCGVRYPNAVFVPLKENGTDETIPFSLTWRPENDNPALRRFLSLAREVAKTAAASSAPSQKPDPSP